MKPEWGQTQNHLSIKRQMNSKSQILGCFKSWEKHWRTRCSISVLKFIFCLLFTSSLLVKATAPRQPGEPPGGVEASAPLVPGVRVRRSNAPGRVGQEPQWFRPKHQPTVPVPDPEGCSLLPSATRENTWLVRKAITVDDRTVSDRTQLQVNLTALAWKWDPKLVCTHVLKTGI